MPIGQNLKHMQDIRGYTTERLAVESGIPASTITKIRSGVTQNPNMETLRQLAKALRCSINDLTDAPTTDEEEIRDLLPKTIKGVSEETLNAFLATLRNQRLAADRTVAELRKDRNFWRKFAVACIGVIIPMLVITMVMVLVMYWDLSHPTEGNILLSYALEHYNLQ